MSPQTGCEGDAEQQSAAFYAALRALAPRGRARVDVRTEAGDEWAHSYAATVKLGDVPPIGPFAWYLANARHEFEFIVFDLDRAKGDVERDADELMELLEAADVRYLVCVSGPGRGLHIWVPIEPTAAAVVRVLARAAARRLPSLDLSPLTNARTGCVRPPGAPHRHGGISTPVDQWVPITPQAAADLLAEPNDAEAVERLAVVLDAADVEPEQIEAEAVRTIESGPRGPRLAGRRRPCDVAALLATTPEVERGHAQLARILVRLALARWSAPETARFLEANLEAPGLIHLRRQGGKRSRPRSPGERAALIARQWERAVAYAATLHRETVPVEEDQGAEEPAERQEQSAQTYAARLAAVVPLVAGVREAISAEPERWSTQAGPSDRRALEYVLELALEAVTDEVEIDCRRLALATGMGRSTAARALGRLVLDEWLSLDTPGEGQRAHRYRVLPQALEDASATPVTNKLPESLAQGGTQGNPPQVGEVRRHRAAREAHRQSLTARRALLSHDVFTHPGPARDQAGLGRHVAITAAALSTGLYKVNDLARVTGYSLRTVRRHLEILKAHQLARRSDRPAPGAWRRTRTSLATVAARIGAAGTRERRHRAYAIERDAYAWWLAELGWMRTKGKRRRPPGPDQTRLLLAGLPRWGNRDRYPRDHEGRADHRAARVDLAMQRLAATA
ncbi:hypothetical protein [Planomonospora sp. ID82291]|uniref:non-homologous end-joining DNA ligase LigD n=1 Tax=Planomonospora sp. ID82291 TaxID=2738136 RepID=UPI0018C435C1|nr:hypothetical protein [Planomonospora sp. ID82291]MBG0819038.1 hypothetical protein [Planomonospora sp. ID82291]